MVILLGASGYIGQSFVEALRARQWPFTPLARKDVDYTDSDTLWRFLRDTRPEFVINAAGFTGKPNVDACETAPADTLLGNTLLPQTLAEICAATSTPWGACAEPPRAGDTCSLSRRPTTWRCRAFETLDIAQT